MEWINNHPYRASLIGAGIALIIGGIIVIEHAQTVAPKGVTTWATDNTGQFSIPNVVSSVQQQSQNNQSTSIIDRALNNEPAPNYTPSVTQTPPAAQQVIADSSNFDFNSFLATLTQAASSTQTKKTASTSTDTFNPYMFIPQGMISTTTAYTQQRTPDQDALYQYGNEAGSYIQSYEKFHTDTTNILQDQINDRNNPDKIAAVEKIGADLAAVGTQMSQMTEIPPQVQSAHDALVASYQEIGKDLALVPQASYDTDFANAIKKYDAAADTFTRHFVSLALIFSINGVKFGPGDPGSVFTFTQSTI